MNNKEIALRLRRLREDRHLTQKEVAAVLGLEQPAYSDRESGATAFKAVDLDKLASFYGKSLDELLRSDQPVVNMHDNSSYGYIHTQNQRDGGDDVLKRLCDLLDGISTTLRSLSEQQAKVIDRPSKQE